LRFVVVVVVAALFGLPRLYAMVPPDDRHSAFVTFGCLMMGILIALGAAVSWLGARELAPQARREPDRAVP
jgi:hypothetical protein